MLRLLGGAVLVLVSAGKFFGPAGCRACRVPYCVVSCGSAVVRVGASVHFSEVRVAWLGPRCRGVPYGAASWAPRNTPVYAGRSRRACGSGALSPWPIACSGEGSGEKEGIRVTVEAPLSLLDAYSFQGCGERVPCKILVGYMC